ncbi:MAG: DNA-protecting protein DprA [Flavobacterium sp.]|nr:MAG: DNA-protecting protein DprA [Flavobacterium sp.]
MRHTELFYLLALQKAEGIGDVAAKRLIQHCGSAEAVFKTKPSQLRKTEGFRTPFIQSLNNQSIFRAAESEMKFIDENAIDYWFFTDDDYPHRLKHCHDGPILLFKSGNIDLANRKIISIVGTRQVTAYGMDFCRKLIEELSPLNPIIVSGFALGVDIAAHNAAIENNLQTIGILAHGLNQIYPKSNKKHAAKVHANGGFITEFQSWTEPMRENFVRRNRIVAGMSEATIVIESAEKGGSLITANMANGYNREVFAVPGRTSDKFSHGCNNLIKTQRANMLTSAADLVYMLNWDLDVKPKPVQKQLFVSLDDDEQKTYDYLSKQGRQLLDVIALDCETPVFRMASLLLGMELKGVVRPLPGKQFEAV